MTPDAQAERSGREVHLRSAARSHTGLIRSNNQDSGYAGPNFLLIADGMGGHAGGDVASAIAVAKLEHLDRPDHGPDVLSTLESAIMDANEAMAERVRSHPELAGMGTTTTALLRTGDRFALAHIGDSRAYLLRDGDLTLVSHDHTFVQLLVDEGRITEEEAEHHPQRSVVMRVLGDVGSAPDLDLSMREAQIGDRWLLCSDGLSGFASFADIKATLTKIEDPGACADQLVELALEGGGADNITVAIGDVVDGPPSGLEAASGEAVGSVQINPHYATGAPGTENLPTEAIDVDAVTSELAPGETGKDTETDADDAPTQETEPTRRERRRRRHQLPDDWGDEEDEQPRRGRLAAWIIGVLVLLLVITAGWWGWNHTQSRYYVGAEQGSVALFRGINQDLGPISLGTLEEVSDVQLEDLSQFTRQRVESGIQRDTRAQAEALIDEFREEAAANSGGQEESLSPRLREDSTDGADGPGEQTAEPTEGEPDGGAGAEEDAQGLPAARTHPGEVLR